MFKIKIKSHIKLKSYLKSKLKSPRQCNKIVPTLKSYVGRVQSSGTNTPSSRGNSDSLLGERQKTSSSAHLCDEDIHTYIV